MANDLERIILEALDAEDPNVLRAACTMAGILSLPQAERGLLKALNHKAWQIQAEAAKALGLIKSQGALRYLRHLLKASDADLRQKILAGAAGVETEGDETHPEAKKQAAIAINRINPNTAQQALLAALASDQPKLITAAMSGLANLQVSECGERVLEIMGNEEASLRSAAAASAGRLRLRQAVPKLLELLKDPEAEVRKEAVIALNHLKAPEAIEPLAESLHDSDPGVKRVAAIALGNTRSRETMVVGALIKGLQDRDSAVRIACLTALASIKAEKALDACAALLADGHEKVRAQAGVTIVALGLARELPDYQR